MATKTARSSRILTKTAHPPGVEGRHKERFASSGECAHRFASFTQTHGRSGNTFFNHGVFYSYGNHFPVARFVQRPKGAARFVLFTTRTYSNSTAGHCSDVRQALNGQTVYAVANVLANTRTEHLENFRGFGSGRAAVGGQVREAFVRVRGTRLETSLRAIVPLAAVLPVLDMVRKCVPYDRDTDPNTDGDGTGVVIDGFKLRRIDVSRNLVMIGCHCITFEEIERAAQKAGL